MAYALGGLLGPVGAHRFYIGGRSTRYGWVILGFLAVTLLLLAIAPSLGAVFGAVYICIVLLDLVLTYPAVQKRNQELLEQARVQVQGRGASK